MKTLLCSLSLCSLSLFLVAPAPAQDDAYVLRWKSAANAATVRYAGFGAQNKDSMLSIFARGVQATWENDGDPRLADPETAPALIYAEALRHIQEIRQAGYDQAVADARGSRPKEIVVLAPVNEPAQRSAAREAAAAAAKPAPAPSPPIVIIPTPLVDPAAQRRAAVDAATNRALGINAAQERALQIDRLARELRK